MSGKRMRCWVVGFVAACCLSACAIGPVAPNWDIDEQALDETTYFFALKAKNFRAGGDGEALQLVRQRARELQAARGFNDYILLDFSAGIESALPFTYRNAQARVRLVGPLAVAVPPQAVREGEKAAASAGQPPKGQGKLPPGRASAAKEGASDKNARPAPPRVAEPNPADPKLPATVRAASAPASAAPPSGKPQAAPATASGGAGTQNLPSSASHRIEPGYD